MNPEDAQILERLVSEQGLPMDWAGLGRWRGEVGGTEEATLLATVWSGMKGMWQWQSAVQQSGDPSIEWNREVAVQLESALPSSPSIQVGPQD